MSKTIQYRFFKKRDGWSGIEQMGANDASYILAKNASDIVWQDVADCLKTEVVVREILLPFGNEPLAQLGSN